MATLLVRLLPVLLVGLVTAPSFAQSFYTSRPPDPALVELTREGFGAKGDGLADDSDALQKAIDAVQEKARQGVLLLPEGRYRLSRTVYVWSGIRVIGYGQRRPVLLLAARTPGFQERAPQSLSRSGTPLVHFVSHRPGAGEPIRDANPGTFYSAMSNVDIEIGDGNPAAIGVRFHVAQHCYLAHMDLRIGAGRAGLEDVGNIAEDLRFFGGEYGILTTKTSPSWPFVLLDSVFEGQRRAAIHTEEAGMTLLRVRARRVPTVVEIAEQRPEQLWLKDSRLSEVSGPAIVVSAEKNARTQINLENVACERVPLLARFRESGKEIAGPGRHYLVRDFRHGRQRTAPGGLPTLETRVDLAPLAAAPPNVPSDVPQLPPQDTWTSVRELGAKGDGTTDDTAALRQAVAEHRSVFLPSGRYRVTDTITLRPDSVLVGLSPISTVIAVDDGTPAFKGPGSPKPLLETAQGGEAIVTGIGLDTGGDNGRAVALKWTAGAGSLVDDVRFLGGHGTYRLDRPAEEMRRAWERIYDVDHTADPDPKRHWDSQYCSLWITDGGGGVFKDIWSPSTYAQAGLCVTQTTTPGRIYAMSLEHHVRNEAILRRVANWQIFALQTEEERGESRAALPLLVEDSRDVTFANLFAYRVVSSYEPFPCAARVERSQGIHFRGLHVYSDSKAAFDAALCSPGGEVRDYELAALTIAGEPPAPPTRAASRVLAQGARVERLAGGFHDITGAAVDAEGDLAFVDTRRQTIYRWSDAGLRIVHDGPLDPAQVAFDASGNMLVVSYAGKGSVFAIRPSAPDELLPIAPQPAAGAVQGTPLLPVSRWSHRDAVAAEATARAPYRFVSPDGSVFIPAGEDFVSGALYYGAKMADVLRAFRLAPAPPGRPFYLGDEAGLRTWRMSVGADGTLSDPVVFAEEGGSGTAVDAAGRVYIAAEQVSVYDPNGTRLETIEVPERPTGLLFGGQDGRTLFVLTRRTLYAVRVQLPE